MKPRRLSLVMEENKMVIFIIIMKKKISKLELNPLIGNKQVTVQTDIA